MTMSGFKTTYKCLYTNSFTSKEWIKKSRKMFLMDNIFSGETFQMKSFKHCFQMVL